MSEKIYDSIISDINSRERWEARQGLWYQMRNDGLARKQKPWPNAADMHFPLVDTTINKLKPGFFQRLIGITWVMRSAPSTPFVQGGTIIYIGSID